jgi:hypothetical protein
MLSPPRLLAVFTAAGRIFEAISGLSLGYHVILMDGDETLTVAKDHD